MAIAAAVYSALTGLAYWRPTVGRRALGVFFAVMGLARNGSLTVKAPEQFRCWPDVLPGAGTGAPDSP
jgi:hypothetical protein